MLSNIHSKQTAYATHCALCIVLINWHIIIISSQELGIQTAATKPLSLKAALEHITDFKDDMVIITGGDNILHHCSHESERPDICLIATPEQLTLLHILNWIPADDPGKVFLTLDIVKDVVLESQVPGKAEQPKARHTVPQVAKHELPWLLVDDSEHITVLESTWIQNKHSGHQHGIPYILKPQVICQEPVALKHTRSARTLAEHPGFAAKPLPHLQHLQVNGVNIIPR
jgi:hypothetical protein